MMNCCCLPCFQKDEKANGDLHNNVPVGQHNGDDRLLHASQHTGHSPPEIVKVEESTLDNSRIKAKQFTFRELATATKHFRQECLLSESGFGRIYRGTLPNGQVVFVKRLDKNSTTDNKDFLAEVLTLSLLRHENLLNLVGYCADGDQKLLVYEYMPRGSVEKHLHDLTEEMRALDWVDRMKIACGTAQGIEYLHEKANPPIIYRDLKSSNIMLDDEFNPKLSDYGLANLGGNNNSHLNIMGNDGYCAPEYENHGELTLKSDVYSFGVILLELITGRRAMDTSKQANEQNLVSWAQPIFKDPNRFPEMADPCLHNLFPVKCLNQAVGVAAMCLHDEPDLRPLISDVVAALSFLAIAPDPVPAPHPEIRAPSRTESRRDKSEERFKAQSRKESRRDRSFKETHDKSDQESSQSSWSECEASFKDYNDEQEDDENTGSDYEGLDTSRRSDDEEKEYDHHQEKVKSKKYPSSTWGRLESMEYEVASMSSSSSCSDNESGHDKTNKTNKLHHGNSSLKMANKSKTKKNGEKSIISRTSRKSSRNTSARLGSRGRNGMVLKDDNVGSYSRRSSTNVGSESGRGVYEKNQSAGLYSKKSTNAGSDTGRGVYEKNQSSGSYSRRSSSAESDNRRFSYEKNQSIGLYSRVSSSVGSHDRRVAYEKNQSIGSYSRRSSISESDVDESIGSGNHSERDENSEVELLT